MYFPPFWCRQVVACTSITPLLAPSLNLSRSSLLRLQHSKADWRTLLDRGGVFPVPGQHRGDSIISLAALPPSLHCRQRRKRRRHLASTTRWPRGKGSDLDIVNCLIPLKTLSALMRCVTPPGTYTWTEEGGLLFTTDRPYAEHGLDGRGAAERKGHC